jgi:hypothetical protein
MHQSHIDTAIAFVANLRSSIEYGTSLIVGRRPFGTSEQRSIELVVEAAVTYHEDRDKRTDLQAVLDQTKAEVERLTEKVSALERFKAYTHQRLDEAGIATHPNGQHSQAGCRVGDRFDILVGERDHLSSEVKELEEGLEFAQCELMNQTYRGNSVSFWHAKAKAYGNVVHGIGPKLGVRDGETLVNAADRLIDEVERLRQWKERSTGRAQAMQQILVEAGRCRILAKEDYDADDMLEDVRQALADLAVEIKGDRVILDIRDREIQALRVDAGRWRAMCGSARIKPWGSAGLGDDKNGYAHIGFEMWTKHEGEFSDQNVHAVEFLTKYADIAAKCGKEG